MRELLLSGEIDAALGEVGVDDARDQAAHSRMPAKRAFDYFRKTGIYPINHGIVVKNALLKDDAVDRRRA